jgi:hypothetical protein
MSEKDARVVGYEVGFTEDDNGKGYVKLHLRGAESSSVTFHTTQIPVFQGLVEVLKTPGEHWYRDADKTVLVKHKGV